MMAVRRGVAGGWRHTLVCGIGSVVGDLFLFMLALLGGHYLLPSLSNPALKVVMAAAGTILLIPVGGYFILLALRDPRKTFAKARKRLGREDLPAHMIGEAARAAALTVFNPLTVLYWAAITSNWLALASLSLGAEAYAWGILMAGAGLASWFALLTLIVRFIPKRFGAVFFRLVNAVLGFVLIGFGAYCALLVYRDHLL
jgi:threonine/homoserine/homoserine lactone efflux protein